VDETIIEGDRSIVRTSDIGAFAYSPAKWMQEQKTGLSARDREAMQRGTRHHDKAAFHGARLLVIRLKPLPPGTRSARGAYGGTTTEPERPLGSRGARMADTVAS
jgi:hypothetical protein